MTPSWGCAVYVFCYNLHRWSCPLFSLPFSHSPGIVEVYILIAHHKRRIHFPRSRSEGLHHSMSTHWSWMSPLFPSSVWTVTCLLNENWLFFVFLNLALFVILFSFFLFLLLWGFLFFFLILWHAKTSILESVKLLKRESVHGSGLEFLPSVFYLFLLVCFKLYFYPLLHLVQCLLSLLFHHLEAMSVEVCSSYTLYSLCLPSYVYLNMKLTCCWFDSLLLLFRERLTQARVV